MPVGRAGKVSTCGLFPPSVLTALGSEIFAIIGHAQNPQIRGIFILFYEPTSQKQGRSFSPVFGAFGLSVTVRPGKKSANTGVFLTNEKTQVSESESHLWKKVDRKSCREGQEEEDLRSTFCEKVDGSCN